MLKAMIEVEDAPHGMLEAETADEMFMQIAALHAEYTARGLEGRIVVGNEESQGPQKDEYAKLFAMGLPPL